MQNFEIILKNEKSKQYDRLALFIVIVNVLCLCLMLYSSSRLNINRYWLIVIIASILFTFLFFLITRDSRKTNAFIFGSLYTGIYWLYIGFWWVGLILAVLALLYYIARQTLQVDIDTNGIHYPSFPERTFTWNELNNAILKNGLLTIDFRNNKLIQQLIDEKETNINEQEFNDFCNKQLNK